MNKSFDGFLEALGMRESGGKYDIKNSRGYIGNRNSKHSNIHL